MKTEAKDPGDGPAVFGGGFSGPRGVSGPGDQFRFTCRLCGQCCSGGMEVYLNPRDVENLARHFRDRGAGLRDRGWLTAGAGQNGLVFPRIRFSRAVPGFCPFVVNHWDDHKKKLRASCSLHGTGAKPLICRLAPLAREVEFFPGGGFTETWSVQPPLEGCPGMKSRAIRSGRAWLAPLEEELAEEREFFRAMDGELRGGASPEMIFSKFFRF